MRFPHGQAGLRSAIGPVRPYGEVSDRKGAKFKEGTMKALIKFLALMLVLSTAEGRVIHIPEDWPDIQTGIEMASDGDTVLVAPGTYLITHPSQRINFEGKAVLLTRHFGISKKF